MQGVRIPMPRKAAELTDMEIRKLKKPGAYPVGGVPGLYIQVLHPVKDDDGNETQAKTWLLRFKFGAKRPEMGLGGYPEIGLKAAREASRLAREDIRKGINPIEKRKAEKLAKLATTATVKTFKELAGDYIRAQETSWRNDKHRLQWSNTLKLYAYPKIGALNVADIGVPHILDVLQQKVNTADGPQSLWVALPETASRVRGRIEAILDYAKVLRLRTGDNPASWRGNLKLALPAKAKAQHHRALPVGQIGVFMKELRGLRGTGARALEFLVLTAARSGEVRGATWAEIDLEAKTWTVPASRMKMGREHRVPLSKAAVDLLKGLPRMAGSDYVFPAPLGGQLSDMALSAVVRRMKAPTVPHGLRSSFRDWAAERTNYPGELAEMALAHAVGNKVEAAYRRGDLFDRRRRLMEDWSLFCAKIEEKPRKGADIIPIGAA